MPRKSFRWSQLPLVDVIVSDAEVGQAVPGAAGRVRVAELRPDRVRLEVDLDTDGYVVLVDAFDPAWRGTAGR